jgi:transcriptional regulator with XRE-family HTH domain
MTKEAEQETEALIYITPPLCRAARALLDMTVPPLAKKIGADPSTVYRFEQGKQDMTRENRLKLRYALEALNIEFADGGWIRHSPDAQ